MNEKKKSKEMQMKQVFIERKFQKHVCSFLQHFYLFISPFLNYQIELNQVGPLQQMRFVLLKSQIST